jgi:hypothetical protein
VVGRLKNFFRDYGKFGGEIHSRRELPPKFPSSVPASVHRLKKNEENGRPRNRSKPRFLESKT